MELISITLPFFLVVALGAYAARSGLVSIEGAKGLNVFVFYFGLPALFIRSLGQRDIVREFQWGYFTGYLLGCCTISLVAITMERRWRRGTFADAAMYAQATTLPNINFLALPILTSAFGDGAIIPLTLSIFAERLILLPILLLLLEYGRASHATLSMTGAGVDQSPGRRLRRVTSDLAVNPLILAVLLGSTLSILKFPVPAVLDRVLIILGGAAAPVALFAVGVGLVTAPVSSDDRQAVVEGTLIKLGLHPLVTAGIFAMTPGVPEVWKSIGVILAGMPLAMNVYVTAQRYQVLVSRVAGITVLSTLIAMPSITLLLAMLR